MNQPLAPLGQGLDAHALMKELSLTRRVFHSESDFQHAFAWLLHDRFPNAQIRLEYRVPGMDRRSYIDIWAVIDGIPLAIELKYKTREMSLSVHGERFDLLSHGAQDIGRYDILKDIARLEEVVRRTPGARGLGLVLTNDSAYWKPARAGACYEPLSLDEGRQVTGTLAWGATAGAGTTKGRNEPICLSGSYDIAWRAYSSLPVTSWSEFRYMAIPVSND
ncbi:MAG: hypothetical protein ACYCX3_06680 [Thermoleophilia bacterium]